VLTNRDQHLLLNQLKDRSSADRRDTSEPEILTRFFEDENSYDCITSLIRSYFSLNNFIIQFNVVNADTLRDAQKHPEQYRILYYGSRAIVTISE